MGLLPQNMLKDWIGIHDQIGFTCLFSPNEIKFNNLKSKYIVWKIYPSIYGHHLIWTETYSRSQFKKMFFFSPLLVFLDYPSFQTALQGLCQERREFAQESLKKCIFCEHSDIWQWREEFKNIFNFLTDIVWKPVREINPDIFSSEYTKKNG